MSESRWQSAVEAGLIKLAPKRKVKRWAKRPPLDETLYTTRGQERRGEVGHPGEAYYSAEEAMAVLGVSRPSLCRLAVNHGIAFVRRQIMVKPKQYSVRSFYEKAGVDRLKVEREG